MVRARHSGARHHPSGSRSVASVVQDQSVGTASFNRYGTPAGEAEDGIAVRQLVEVVQIRAKVDGFRSRVGTKIQRLDVAIINGGGDNSPRGIAVAVLAENGVKPRESLSRHAPAQILPGVSW